MNEAKAFFEVFSDRDKKLYEEARKADAERKALAAINTVWPQDHKVTRVYYTNSFRELGNVTITAKVESREEALAYLDAFQLQELVFFKGHGISTIRALKWVRAESRGKYENEITGIYPMYWRSQSGLVPTLNACIEFDDLRANLHIQIEKDQSQRIIKRHTDFGRDSLIEWTLNNVPGGEAVRYAGTVNHPGEVLVYFHQEPGGAAPTMSELLCAEHRFQTIAWHRR